MVFFLIFSSLTRSIFYSGVAVAPLLVSQTVKVLYSSLRPIPDLRGRLLSR